MSFFVSAMRCAHTALTASCPRFTEEVRPLQYLFNVWKLSIEYQDANSARALAAARIAAKFGPSTAPKEEDPPPLWQRSLNRTGWTHLIRQLADGACTPHPAFTRVPDPRHPQPQITCTSCTGARRR